MYLRVYTADTGPLSEAATFDRLLRLVSDERRERVMSKARTDDRAASLAAGLLLSMATESMGLPGADEYIRCNAYGKPYYDLAAYEKQSAFRLPRVPQVYFNLSHSHERAMCAVSDVELGCDVEQIRPEVMRSAAAMLHPGETAELEALTDEAERMKMFFRYWTVKESYVKALGCGYTGLKPRDLRVRQEHYEMRIYDPHPGMADRKDICSTGQEPAPVNTCRLYEWDMYDGYRYACCMLAPDEETAAQLPDEEPELTQVDLTDIF